LNARLYLAAAYAQQYIPGAETEDNKRMAASAIEEYKQVLTRDPKNINAVKGIAVLYLQIKDFDQAKQYYQKAATVDSNDPDNYYSIAVIDWTQAYKLRQEQRSKLGMKPTDQLKDKRGCSFVKTNNQAPVEEGIKMLQKALQIRPDYDEAMTFLNLLYRERADYECDDASARAADAKMANDWFDKSLATKKAKAEKQGAGGIVIDQQIGQKIDQKK
jgi:tetratricopeptide (TPR) repeat protein